MGGYIRIYPSTDWAREKLYKTLLKSASVITLIGEYPCDTVRVAFSSFTSGEKNHGTTYSHTETPSSIQKMKVIIITVSTKVYPGTPTICKNLPPILKAN